MKLQLFHLRFDTVLIRFYVMMALVIGGMTLGWYWMAFLAVPVFLSTLLGVRVVRVRQTNLETKQTRRHLLQHINTLFSFKHREAA